VVVNVLQAILQQVIEQKYLARTIEKEAS